MLKLATHEIAGYLDSKGLDFRRRGKKAECKICPFCKGGEHSDRYTFVVYLDESGGNYKCMRGSCGQTGSFWQLAESFGDNPKDFYESDNKVFKTKQEKPLIRQKEIKYDKPEVQADSLTPEALDYLQKRGFTPEVLDSVSIWCDEKGLINFGYYHKDELCFVKIRQPRKPRKDEQKAWAIKGGLRTLWGLEQCNFTLPYLIITFGEYDRIACKQADLSNVVSVPSGDEDLEWIEICYNDLQKFSQIYLWIDNDEAGKRALPKVASRLGEEKIKVIKTDFKDANEMLLLRGKEVGFEQAQEEIFKAVEDAEWHFTGDLIQVSEIGKRDLDTSGYKSSLAFINKTLGGYLNGRLTIHLGDSKAGKSTVINQETAFAIEQGAKVCVWSGEDDEFDYKYKIAVHIGGYVGTDMLTSEKYGREYAVIKPEFETPINEFLHDRLILLNRRYGINEDNLLESFELAYKRYGCTVFVVDNLTKLVTAKDTPNVNFRQAQVVNKLSDFTKDKSVHAHIIHHTNKAGSQSEPPTKYSSSGAKQITDLADSVVAWWRIPDESKGQFDGKDTLSLVLANRVFGDEDSCALVYDQRVKRFGADIDELSRLYSLNGN